VAGLTRRDFIRLAGLGVGGVILSGCETPGGETASGVSILPAPTSAPDSGLSPDVEILLEAAPGTAMIHGDAPTDIWRLSADVVSGDPAAVEEIPGSYLGPILRFRRGQRVRITFTNNIPEESIIHWHGLHVPADMDGHPRLVIDTGGTYVYEFEVLNRAGTYWYHPHPHGRTGPQAYAGMAGLLIVSDDEESVLGLPSGEYDVPLVLQDRRFDTNDQLVYLSGGMMDRMMGFLGDELLINGMPDLTLPVAARPYRLRFLNGSNSRIYKLAWDDGTPLAVIGTDGGLLERPVHKPYVALAPAERIELWVDFSAWDVGTDVSLVSLPFTAGEIVSGQFPVLTARVAREASDTAVLPDRLTELAPADPASAVRRREVLLEMGMGGFTLNGRTFEMTDVAPEEQVPAGDLEMWEFVNVGGETGMGGMGMGGMGVLPHPMHMHGTSFRVIERIIDDAGRAGWETLSDGFVDEGWKDTVLVVPGERVTVLKRFGRFKGLFLYHCHNLEHEDMGMMHNFELI